MNLNKPQVHANSYLAISRIVSIFFHAAFLLFFTLCPLSKINGQNVALNFDGSNDYINTNIDELSTGNPAHTIEAWIYIDALPARRSWPLNLGQFNTGSHHWLLTPNGDFVVGVFAGAQISTTIPVGTWTHIASVFNGTNLSVYVNGELEGTIAAHFNFWNQGFHLGRPWANENYFNGTVDDVRIWNKALSSSTIADDRFDELTGNESGLIAYYNFNEGIENGNNGGVSNVVDRTGNENHFSMFNFTKSGTSSNWVATHPRCAGAEPCINDDPCYNRLYNEFCECEEEFVGLDDCDCTNPGAEPCESDNPCYSSYLDSACNCIEEFIGEGNCDCEFIPELCCDEEGTPCDDGNPNTYNDLEDGLCNCSGTPISFGCTYAEPNNAQFLIKLSVISSLSCEDGNADYDGIINISTAQYAANDWFLTDFFDCNGRGGVIIIRGDQFTDNPSRAVSRSSFRPCFSENWTVSNPECGGSLTFKINVFDDNTTTSLDLNSTIASDTYFARNTITSTGTVSATGQVKLIAGQAIVLEPGFTVAANGTFSALIESISPCSALNRMITAPNTFQGFSEENIEQDYLEVYPNPFTSQTMLSYKVSQPETVSITLMGLNGQILRNIQNPTLQEAGTYNISIGKEALLNGIYFIQFNSPSKNRIKKVVVF